MRRALDRLLFAARGAGLFGLARRLTRQRLRILGYHGAALDDESEFQPMLFMRPATFRARLEQLERLGYPVLPLARALEQLRAGRLPPCAVVITIDDGWYGTYLQMAPALARHGFPATLYLSTYYVEKQLQVFNVAAAYALWKSRAASIDLASVDQRLGSHLDLSQPAARELAARRLVELADGLGSATDRQELLERLFARLNLDFEPIRRQRLFTFMSSPEAAQLAASGVDLQLHTHRHRFPGACRELLAAEVDDNRRALSRLASGPFRHLCYPSGEYDGGAFDWLRSMGIDSATTTLQGMNQRSTHPLELRRFLDSEDISPIRFEAELSGFLDLLREAAAGRRNDPRRSLAGT